MINSVTESLKLLNLVAQHPNTGLSELSRLSGLNKSRTFRMLSTLCAHHYVIQHSDGSYRLGHQLLILGQYARNQTTLIQVVDTESDLLTRQFNENLQLRIIEENDVIEKNDVVQIWRKSSSQSLQVTSMAGNRRPLGAGAAGKLLLAYAKPPIQQAFLDSLSPTLAQETQHTLAQIRKNGYAISQSELTQGVGAIACPIFDFTQECIASFSMSIPQIRLESTRLDDITTAMKHTSQQISTLLGFIPPAPTQGEHNDKK